MMATPVQIQLSEPVATKVERLAARERLPVAEMVQLLTEEALKLRELPAVIFTDGPTGRRATLLHGPDVWEVIEPYLLAGKDWEALQESYPQLDEAMLRTAVRYDEAYPDEIEARIARNQAPRACAYAI
jgi:hypothetical protein